MAKVLHSLNCFYWSACCSADFTLCRLFQSCDEGEEDDEEAKDKTFEVLLISQECISLCFWITLRSGAHCNIVSHRKRKWRSKRCCTSRPDYMIEELQRWCFRWSVLAKVGRDIYIRITATFNIATIWRMICGHQVDLVLWWLSPSNSASPSSTGETYWCSRYTWHQSACILCMVDCTRPLLIVLLSWCRKCWTTWRKKETLAFSKVCLDWWCLAGNEDNYHTQNTGFTFCFISAI